MAYASLDGVNSKGRRIKDCFSDAFQVWYSQHALPYGSIANAWLHENIFTNIIHIRSPVAVCSQGQAYCSCGLNVIWKKYAHSEQQQMNVTVMFCGCALIHAGMNTEVSGLPCICPPTHPAFPPRCWVPSRVVRDSLPAGGCLSLRAESLLADGLHLQLAMDTHTHN